MNLSHLLKEHSDTCWEVVSESIEKKVVGYCENLTLLMIRYKKGGIELGKETNQTKVAFVSEGTFEIKMKGTKKILQKGDSFLVPSYLTHEVKCIDDGVLVNVCSHNAHFDTLDNY